MENAASSFSKKPGPSNFILVGKIDGFSTVYLLGFLPIIITILWSLQLVTTFIQLKAIPLAVCRIQSLQIQSHSATALTELLKLNPLVKNVRIQKTSATAALSAAVLAQNPPAISAALRWLQRVKSEQALLATAQRAIQAKLLLQVNAETMKMKSVVNIESKILQRKVDFFLKFQGLQLTIPPYRLAAKPDIHSADPAIYTPEEPFSQNQTWPVFWKGTFGVAGDHWLHQFFKNQSSYRGECSSSIFKENQTWIPKLWEQNREVKLF